MRPRDLFDDRQRTVSLGAKLASGGEADVFIVNSAPNILAKIYKKPQDAEKVQKLRAMVALNKDDLQKTAAWPNALLHNSPNGPVVGITIRRILEAKEIHVLYSPAHRKVAFPQADWHFLIHAAMNCAIAFDSLHVNGIVAGDVNQSNILVSRQGMVALIDCDSFQIRVNGRELPCDVGVPLFTPPELQNKAYRGLVRTPNHDRFGLAVLIFQLLFMGRHPFSGHFLGKGEMTLERAIGEFRFVYGRAAVSYQMQLPVHSLPMTAMPPAIADLFECAFGKSSAEPNARPSAADWAQTLGKIKHNLLKCKRDPGHVYSSHLSSCPWCGLMSQGAPNFFIAVALTRGGLLGAPVFSIEAFWAKVERVPVPNARYQRPIILPAVPKPVPPNCQEPIPKLVRIPPEFTEKLTGCIALIAAFLILSFVCAPPVSVAAALTTAVFGGWWLVLEWKRKEHEGRVNEKRNRIIAAIRQEAARRNAALNHAEARLHGEESNWQARASHHSRLIAAKMNEMQVLRQEYSGYQDAYSADLLRLQQEVRLRQLEHFLAQQFIADGQIQGVGASRKAVLASHGIETALDIDYQRIIKVQGFGPKLAGTLLKWRQVTESRFVFNAAAGIPTADRSALDLKYAQLRQQTTLKLQQGLDHLTVLSAEASQELNQILQRIVSLAEAAEQARGDLAVLPKVA
jgi:DNA-binding helix-hairpin-helix protein with protein kinase domain